MRVIKRLAPILALQPSSEYKDKGYLCYATYGLQSLTDCRDKAPVCVYRMEPPAAPCQVYSDHCSTVAFQRVDDVHQIRTCKDKKLPLARRPGKQPTDWSAWESPGVVKFRIQSAQRYDWLNNGLSVCITGRFRLETHGYWESLYQRIGYRPARPCIFTYCTL